MQTSAALVATSMANLHLSFAVQGRPLSKNTAGIVNGLMCCHVALCFDGPILEHVCVCVCVCVDAKKNNAYLGKLQHATENKV